MRRVTEMARTVGVRLRADPKDLIAGMEASADATLAATNEIVQGAEKAQASLKKIDTAARDVGAGVAAGASEAQAGTAKIAASADKAATSLDREAASTRKVREEGDKLGAQQDPLKGRAEQAERARRSNELLGQSYNDLALASAAVGAASVGAAVVAVSEFAEFDQAISAVAASGEDARASIDQIRAASIDAGAETVYNATESANAVENLAKAGQSAANILGGGLRGSLDLAAAGAFGVADAASIMAGALTQFNLKGEQAGHVADVLAAGAGKAQGSTQDLGLALTYVGGPLGSLDVSLEETAGTLSFLANNMIIGERAGTSLRSMIASLTSPTAKAQAEMNRLGIEVFDSQGKFVGLDGVAGQLHETLADATDAERQMALGILFGNEALQAATALTIGGSDAIHKWTSEVDDQGYAAEAAAIRLDNLSGDLEKLKGALDSALIQTGSEANGVLRFLTQAATGLVDMIGGAPGPILAVGLALTTLVGAVGLAGGAYFLAAPKVEAFKQAVSTTSIVNGQAVTSTSRLGSAVLGLGKFLPIAGVALAAGAILLGNYAQKQEENRRKAEALADSINDVTGALTDQSRELVASELEPYTELWNRLGLTLGDVTSVVTQGGPAYEALIDNLIGVREAGSAAAEQQAAWRAEQGISAEEATRLGVALDGQRSIVEQGIEIKKAAKEAEEAAGDAAGGHAKSLDELATQLDVVIESTPELSEEQSILADRLNLSADGAIALANGLSESNRQQQIATGGTVALIESGIAYQRALVAADETIQKLAEDSATYGQVLIDEVTGGISDTTEAGRLLSEALIQIRDDTLAHRDAIIEQTNSVEDGNAAIDAGRQALFEKAKQYFATEQQAWDYVDSILAIPTDVGTDVTITDNGTISDLEARLAQATRDRYARVLVDYVPGRSGFIPGTDEQFGERSMGPSGMSAPPGESGGGVGLLSMGGAGGFGAPGEPRSFAPVGAVDAMRDIVGYLPGGAAPSGDGVNRRIVGQNDQRPSMIVFNGFPGEQAADVESRYWRERGLLQAAVPYWSEDGWSRRG